MNKSPVLKNLQNCFLNHLSTVRQKALETLQYISGECRYGKMWICSGSHKPYDWLSKFLVSVKKRVVSLTVFSVKKFVCPFQIIKNYPSGQLGKITYPGGVFNYLLKGFCELVVARLISHFLYYYCYD